MFFPNNRSQWRVFHLWFGHYSNAKVMCGDRGSGGDWRITELKGATWLQKIFSKWGLKKKACFVQTRDDMDMVWHGGWLKKVWSCSHLLLKILPLIFFTFFHHVNIDYPSIIFSTIPDSHEQGPPGSSMRSSTLAEVKALQDEALEI